MDIKKRITRTKLTETETEFIETLKTITDFENVDNKVLSILNDYMIRISKEIYSQNDYITKDTVLNLKLNVLQWNILSFFQIIHIDRLIPFIGAVLQFDPLFIRTLEYFLTIKNNECETLMGYSNFLDLFILCYDYTNTYDVLEDRDIMLDRIIENLHI